MVKEKAPKKKYPSELNSRFVRAAIGDYQAFKEMCAANGITQSDGFHVLLTSYQSGQQASLSDVVKVSPAQIPMLVQDLGKAIDSMGEELNQLGKQIQSRLPVVNEAHNDDLDFQGWISLGKQRGFIPQDAVVESIVMQPIVSDSDSKGSVNILPIKVKVTEDGSVIAVPDRVTIENGPVNDLVNKPGDSKIDQAYHIGPNGERIPFRIFS